MSRNSMADMAYLDKTGVMANNKACTEACSKLMGYIFPKAVTIYLFIIVIFIVVIVSLTNYSGFVNYKYDIKETFFYSIIVFIVWNLIFFDTACEIGILFSCIMAMIIQFYMRTGANSEIVKK